MRLIDADALLEKAWDANTSIGYVQVVDVGDVIDAPTVSPDEVRGVGKWIDSADFEQCSVCKGSQLKEFQSKYGKTIRIRTPYCPNCGARMEVSEDTRKN